MSKIILPTSPTNTSKIATTERVFQLSDRVAFLDQGKLLAQGSSQDILKDPHLAAIYFGDHA